MKSIYFAHAYVLVKSADGETMILKEYAIEAQAIDVAICAAVSPYFFLKRVPGTTNAWTPECSPTTPMLKAANYDRGQLVLRGSQECLACFRHLCIWFDTFRSDHGFSAQQCPDLIDPLR